MSEQAMRSLAQRVEVENARNTKKFALQKKRLDTLEADIAKKFDEIAARLAALEAAPKVRKR